MFTTDSPARRRIHANGTNGQDLTPVVTGNYLIGLGDVADDRQGGAPANVRGELKK
jgi:hypothetical protein